MCTSRARASRRGGARLLASRMPDSQRTQRFKEPKTRATCGLVFFAFCASLGSLRRPRGSEPAVKRELVGRADEDFAVGDSRNRELDVPARTVARRQLLAGVEAKAEVAGG